MVFKRVVNRMNIKQRLILYFLIVAMAPTIIISAGIYIRSSRIITSRVNKSVQKNLSLIHDNLVLKLNEFDSIADFIYLNSDFLEIISSVSFSNYYGDVYSSFGSGDEMTTINELTTLNRLMDEFIINHHNNIVIPTLYIYNKPQYNKFSFTNRIYDLSYIEDEEWYIRLPHRFNYKVIGSVRDNSGNYSLRVVKRLYSLRHMDVSYCGLLALDINVNELNSIFKNSTLTPGSKLIVVDGNNEIILGNDNSLTGKSLSETKFGNSFPPEFTNAEAFLINASDMLVSVRNIEELGWKIINYSPVRELKEELYQYKKVIVFIILFCTVIGIIVSIRLSSNITYPIKLLVNSMYVTESGDFNTPIAYDRKDEFSVFVDKHNEMILRIKELIYKLYVSEIKEKDAELKSLQAQINPHFLYNTLDSINWMAMDHQAEDISRMVISLSDFFRYSLNRGKNIISLRDEKKQIESYLTIQKIRYGDKLDYHLDFGKSVLDYVTVKLVIQPLVENSIVHGIEKVRRKGFIAISCLKDGKHIVLKVTDNGTGCDVEELNHKLSKNEECNDSIGIYNVNLRIRKVFGSGYGLTYERNVEGGVTATLTFPAIDVLEG
jgi:two-component system, sensor histidine kinase YesM